MPTKLAHELRVAVAFLKTKGIIKKNEDVAKTTGVSPSMLSQILSGRKIPSPEFLQTFQDTYKINLEKRATYTDLENIDINIKGFTNGIDAKSYLETYDVMWTLIRSKDQQIEALEKVVNELRRQVWIYTQVFFKYENAILQAHMDQTGHPEVRLDPENQDPGPLGQSLILLFKEAGILEIMQDPERSPDEIKDLK